VVPLSPLSFLRRTADVFPDTVAVVDPGAPPITYAELYDRASRLASGLRSLQVARGESVAVLAPNGLPMLEAHFGVPGSGGVLVAMNTRLSAGEYAYILRHCGARVLIVDESLLPQAREAVAEAGTIRSVFVIGGAPELGEERYEALLAGSDGRGLLEPDSELDPITVNYTSGTTGRPKGVVYTHRGAYLNSLSVALGFGLSRESVYLWTLPMFHCNGWCFIWAVTAVAARHVCLPKPDAAAVIAAIDSEHVTHLCGAPVVVSAIVRELSQGPPAQDRSVRAAVGGAPPTPADVARAQAAGLNLLHLYGMTETYGPSLVCEPQDSWRDLDSTELAGRMARQGVRGIAIEDVRVVHADFSEVPRDGSTLGEIVVRSNTTMDRYLHDEEATAAARVGDYVRTGDLAVRHPDGYIEIRDRSKDIIISGGENVSSIEVERVLAQHPDVVEVAVVAASDQRWGEVPVAFVTLTDESPATERELIDFVRDRIAHFKAPKRVIFDTLPKTSTGKVQKSELRARIAASTDEAHG
jgi:fatty-acyl-CoA synthase